MKATLLIELKKPVGKFRAGQRIKATAAELAALKLSAGTDFRACGTLPTPEKSDLAGLAASGEGAEGKAPPPKS